MEEINPLVASRPPPALIADPASQQRRGRTVAALLQSEAPPHGNEAKWKKHISDLCAFKEARGHFDVPARFQQNQSLGKWVYRIRNGKDYKLTPARIEELDKLGFQHGRDKSTGLLPTSIANPLPVSNKGRWEQNIAAIRLFKMQNGHCNVPSSYPENQSLSHWVRCVRQTRTSLKPERVQQLKELEFVFYPHDEKWKKHIDDLIAFKGSHGHLDVPRSYKDNPSLSTWVYSIRKNRRLTPARIEELDKLGF
jgi:hypothetical protein